jgi:hypothetical protein
MASPVTRRLLALPVLLLAAACAGAEGRGTDASLPARPQRMDGAIEVRQVAVSAPEAAFSAIPDLAVDSRGSVYVPDAFQHRVVVLNPDGSVARAIGRRGAGPGEFRMIRGVQVLPGDSLLVYDPELARVSVYARGAAEPAYTAALGSRFTRGVPFTLRRTGANNAYLAIFRPGFVFRAGADFAGRRERVAVLELDGTERRGLLEYPAAGRLVVGSTILEHPFAQQGFARLDSRGRVHFAWSDTLGASAYSLSGERAGGFRHAYTPPPVTDGDVSEVLAGVAARMRAHVQPVLADSTPERWPAIREMLMDDRDRLWMALGGPRTQPAEWIAFDPAGAYLGSMMVPAGSDVRVIRANGMVYAARMGEDDVPRVVAYRMTRLLR